MKVILTQRFKSCLRGWSEADLQAAGGAINTAAATFGQPHLHKGRGIRQLKPRVYETRAGTARRLIFTRADDALFFEFAGNHDQVQAYLKNRR